MMKRKRNALLRPHNTKLLNKMDTVRIYQYSALHHTIKLLSTSLSKFHLPITIFKPSLFTVLLYCYSDWRFVTVPYASPGGRRERGVVVPLAIFFALLFSFVGKSKEKVLFPTHTFIY